MEKSCCNTSHFLIVMKYYKVKNLHEIDVFTNETYDPHPLLLCDPPLHVVSRACNIY